MLLNHFTAFYDIQALCEVVSYCDNIRVIRRTEYSNHRSAREALLANYDAIEEIHKQQQILRRKIPRMKQGQHVKGHQDNQQYNNLSRQAQLNIRAHELATSMYQTKQGKAQMIELTSRKAYLITAREIQTNQETSVLRCKWRNFELQPYYRKKLNLTETQLFRINWETYRSARRNLLSEEQTFAIKMLTRWLPTGHRPMKYGREVRCMKCGNDETVDHLFKCKERTEWKLVRVCGSSP